MNPFGWLLEIEDALPNTEGPLTWGRLLRSAVAAAGMLTATWLIAIRLDQGHREAGATLVAGLICTPAAALLGYPVGYYGSRFGMAIANRLGLRRPRWVLIGIGAFLLGMVVGALPWALLMGYCRLAPYFHWSQC